MLASRTADAAALILATAALVLAAGVLILIWKKGLKSVSFRMAGLETKLEAVDGKVDQINTAVNHVPEGSRTLVQRVTTIESETRAHRAWETEVFRTIAAQIGCDIPEAPPVATTEAHT